MDKLSVTVELPRSTLAAAGIRESEVGDAMRTALDLYRAGRISLGKAAEMAGVSTKWEMLGELAKHDLWLDYTAEDARSDADAILSLTKA